MQYIISIGIFQALVAIVLLWKNKLRSTADDLLILLIACIATHLSIKLVIYNFIDDIQVRHQMNTFIGFCYGPLLYLYAVKVRHREFIPASKWYVFLPLILGAIAYFTVAGVLYFSESSGHRLLRLYNEVSFWSLLVADLVFVYLSLKQAANIKTPAHRKERQMIERIAYCFLIISVLSLSFYFIVHYFGPGSVLLIRTLIYGMLACLCVMIIRYKYVAVNNSAVTDEDERLPLSPTVESTVPEESNSLLRKTVLSEEEQRTVWLSLEAQLKQDRLFVDSELNLDKLAQITGINKYHISETLNSFAHKSFYQYINEYRIDFALQQMQDLHRKSIAVNMLSIAYDAGFKAKSSFNRYFKEIAGATPTEYLKSLSGIQLVKERDLK